MKSMNKSTIGAFAVIFNNQREVLLCHRTDMDMWNLPGGRVEKNETPWGAAVREVKEETGFKITVTGLCGVYSKPKENDLVMVFLCDIISGKARKNHEADRIEFFNPYELPVNTLPRHKDRIIKALCPLRRGDVILVAQYKTRSVCFH